MYRLLRPALFALDPERAHALALRSAQLLGRWPLEATFGGSSIELMGLRFPNRVGLAAGFDKNGTAIDGLGRLGFGCVEVGTVTPLPQAGQPAPRLFRLRAHDALINRLGFPNDGAEAIAQRLRHRRAGPGRGGIVGVNIGKNADTPLEHAIDDYVSCLRTVHAVADYIAVNVSSPNTPNLRSLQEGDRLEPLLTALLQERSELRSETGRRVPLLVKLSPDLRHSELADTAMLLKALRIDGIIATNTTITRDTVQSDPQAREAGGLSGPPLHGASLLVVKKLRAWLGPAFPIIGVGGIDSPERALAMRTAGADLIQLYTALVYRGPGCMRTIAHALEASGQPTSRVLT
jgi:dihydroorotate dehydrogenase